MVRGQACSKNCTGRVHQHCFDRLKRGREYGCRVCSRSWSTPENQDRMVHVGPAAFEKGQDRRHMKRLSSAESDGEAEDNSTYLEDAVSQPSQTQGKRLHKK